MEVGFPWFAIGNVFLDGESLDVTFGGCQAEKSCDGGD